VVQQSYKVNLITQRLADNKTVDQSDKEAIKKSLAVLNRASSNVLNFVFSEQRKKSIRIFLEEAN